MRSLRRREAESRSTGGRTVPRSFRRDEAKPGSDGLTDLGAGRRRGDSTQMPPSPAPLPLP